MRLYTVYSILYTGQYKKKRGIAAPRKLSLAIVLFLLLIQSHGENTLLNQTHRAGANGHNGHVLGNLASQSVHNVGRGVVGE